MSHGVQRHRSPIRPAPDRHSVFIQLRILREKLIDRSQLILELNSAELMPDCRLKLAIPSRSPAIVHRKNSEPFACHDLIEQRTRPSPAFEYKLRRRTAVNIHDQRNLAVGRGVGRKQQPPIQSRSILRLEFQKLLRRQAIVSYASRLPYWIACPIDRAQREFWRHQRV